MTTSNQPAGRRRSNPLPQGAVAIGWGMLVNGVSTYGFLALARRATGQDGYSDFAVVWSMLLIVGPGIFQPVEQETSRATARSKSAGTGPATSLRPGLAFVGIVSVVVAVMGAATWPLGTGRLFSDTPALLAALLAGLAAFGVLSLIRGSLSGAAEFGRYAGSITAEGTARLMLGGALVVIGSQSPVVFSVVLAVALIAACGVLPRRASRPAQHAASDGASDGASKRASDAGPWESPTESPGRPLSAASLGTFARGLGPLLVTSMSEAFLLNAGTLVVQAAQSPSRPAGVFLNGLVVSRVPLFLFTAVKVALLPELTRFAHVGDRAGFRRSLGRLLVAVGAITVIGTAGAAWLGPTIIELVFKRHHRPTWTWPCWHWGARRRWWYWHCRWRWWPWAGTVSPHLGWIVADLSFLAALALPVDPFRRAELAQLVAMSAAVATMGWALVMRHGLGAAPAGSAGTDTEHRL